MGAMLTGATQTPIGTIFTVLFYKNVGQWVYAHFKEKKEKVKIIQIEVSMENNNIFV